MKLNKKNLLLKISFLLMLVSPIGLYYGGLSRNFSLTILSFLTLFIAMILAIIVA